MKIKVRNIEEFNELIIKKGFTKNGLAKKANISSTMIVQLSNGDRNPSPPVAKRVCQTLGVEFDDIFIIEKQDELISK